MHTRRPFLALGMAFLALLACNLGGQTPPATADEAAIAAAVAATLTAQAPIPTDLPIAAEPSATEAPATPEATPTPGPTPTVVHVTFPANPGSAQAFIVDRSSAALAGERRSIGDNFSINLYERPFTSQEMEYRPHLDITRAEISAASPWFYVTIYLEGTPADDAWYAVELDLDLDGRGDWFIGGLAPQSAEWTTDGVFVFRDPNNDVGGSVPLQAESPTFLTDGYEEQVFDQGIGPDPDAAWIRLDPSDSTRVQIAFKAELIGFDGEFLWGAWTDAGVQEPAFMDYNDHFTPQQAGSPVLNSQFYPLQDLAEVDNTCRWAYGFVPVEPLPGLCPLPEPTPTPEPLYNITGQVFWDSNSSGSRDGGEGWAANLNPTVIELRQGNCGGTVLASKTLTSGGSFAFGGLPAGSYCVRVASAPVPATTATEVNLSLPPDGHVEFGFFQLY